MKKLILLGLLGFASALQAQPQVGGGIGKMTDTFLDFEDGQTVFEVLGEGGKVSLDKNKGVAKEGNAALRFDYPLGPGQFNALIKNGQPGEASKLKSFRFWVKSDYATTLVFVLQEQDSGRHVALINAPKNQWQRVELSLDDFVLSTNADDPQDNNGRLDMDLVVAAALADFKQIFVQNHQKVVVATETKDGAAGKTKTTTEVKVEEKLDPAIAKLLGIQTGPHSLWVDNFEASREALPPFEVDPNALFGTFVLDSFLRPQLSWAVMGDALVKQVTEAGLKEQGRAITVHGQGLQAEYRQQPGSIIGLVKPFLPGTLKDMAALRFAVATEKPMTLLLQLEETSGGKYNTTVELPADNKPGEVRLVPMLFEQAEDSRDNNNRLDLAQVKHVSFIDVTGFLGGAVADNVLWLSNLRVEKKAP